MSIFAVILTDPQDETKHKIEAVYPDSYQMASNVFLVSSNGLTKEVSNNLGIGEGGTDGVVFRLNHAYAGYTSRETWEWLSRAEQPA